MRPALWLTGLLAAGLYAKVGWFAMFTLRPELGCCLAPEMRPWGYGTAVFDNCFRTVSGDVRDAYRDVLTGVDRLLALALGVYMALLAIRYRAWPGVLAAAVYVLADWRENSAFVDLLDGAGNVAVASTWTITKFATLGCVVLICLWYVRRERKMQ